MNQDDRPTVVLHTIDEIVEDGAVADAWAFAGKLCKQTGNSFNQVVTTFTGYQVRILVSPPQAAATISIWSPTQNAYVVIYRDEGVGTAKKFVDA
jgi:hypothetical protein